MYLPLGSSTLLPLLQFPLSLLSSELPTQRFVTSNSNGNYHGHTKSWNNLGNIAPYHDAPNVPGVSVDLPDDCTVKQVILLHRHGSRGPLGQEKYILKLVDTLEKARAVIQAADLPPYLAFLAEGYKYDLVPKELTVLGRKELFDHGVEFALRYPTFSTEDIVSTTVPRVIDSAHFFSQGLFGRGAEDIRHLTTENFTDPVSWLAPWEACPKLSYDESSKAARKWQEKYIPPIVERFNRLVPGVGFSFDNILGALYACPFDLAARNESPWCGVLTTRELRGLEYELDLLLDGYSGHASRGDPGPLVGAFYVKKLIERLTDDAKPLYLDFAHETSILLALSALGLNKTSDQTPFAANMVWEKFTCKESFNGPQVRLILNQATFPLSICEQTKEDKKYGTCSLDEFVQANEYNLNVQYHSQTWNATCGLNH